VGWEGGGAISLPTRF